eukprot:1980270-Pyramimonas_sp.AAC.1
MLPCIPAVYTSLASVAPSPLRPPPIATYDSAPHIHQARSPARQRGGGGGGGGGGSDSTNPNPDPNPNRNPNPNLIPNQIVSTYEPKTNPNPTPSPPGQRGVAVTLFWPRRDSRRQLDSTGWDAPPAPPLVPGGLSPACPPKTGRTEPQRRKGIMPTASTTAHMAKTAAQDSKWCRR